jgi:hypothetical protein
MRSATLGAVAENATYVSGEGTQPKDLAHFSPRVYQINRVSQAKRDARPRPSGLAECKMQGGLKARGVALFQRKTSTLGIGCLIFYVGAFEIGFVWVCFGFGGP